MEQTGFKLSINMYLSLFKPFLDFLHPGYLIHMEWAAVIAVPALNTAVRLYLQFPVMIYRQRISRPGQIIILIDQPDIQSCRTWGAVIAVHAGAFRIMGRKGADHRIIRFLR